MQLSDAWRDGAALVAFVNSYCEGCQETLQAVRRAGVTDKVRVVYVVLGPSRGSFAMDAKPAHVVEGGEGDAHAYGVRETPSLFLVARGGVLRWKHQGGLDPGALRDAVKDTPDLPLLAVRDLGR